MCAFVNLAGPFERRSRAGRMAGSNTHPSLPLLASRCHEPCPRLPVAAVGEIKVAPNGVAATGSGAPEPAGDFPGRQDRNALQKGNLYRRRRSAPSLTEGAPARQAPPPWIARRAGTLDSLHRERLLRAALASAAQTTAIAMVAGSGTAAITGGVVPYCAFHAV
jgi:hypothetical protein